MSDSDEKPERRRHPADAVTWEVRVAAAWAWRLLLLAAALWVLGQAWTRLELVVMSFVLALFLTAVLHPLERLIHKLVPKPASVSAGLALLIGVAVLSGIGYFVAWQISSHSEALGNQLQDVVDRTRTWLQNGPLHLNAKDLQNISDKITKAISDHQGELLSGAVETVRTVAELLGALLLILLSTFFLLRDGEKIWRFAIGFVPRTVTTQVDRAGRAGWHTLGGYMRGQVLIALFHGISVMIILAILRIPLAAALGVLIFLGSFIPLIGLTVTGALCVAVALLEHGATAAIVVAIAIVVLIQVESHFLQPVIMSRSVEVHPLAIALAVFSGTLLAGIPGALLAVPFVAFVNTTVRALQMEQRSEAAGEPPPTEAELETALEKPSPRPKPSEKSDESGHHSEHG
jgi:predicted PurR-regulated permease PerM